MVKKAYVLTEQQLNNLAKFLERADLKGAEVGAYTDLIKAFNNPYIIEDKPQEASTAEAEQPAP